MSVVQPGCAQNCFKQNFVYVFFIMNPAVANAFFYEYLQSTTRFQIEAKPSCILVDLESVYNIYIFIFCNV